MFDIDDSSKRASLDRMHVGRGWVLCTQCNKSHMHEIHLQVGRERPLRVQVVLHCMICHKKCHRPRTSSCHKEQGGAGSIMSTFQDMSYSLHLKLLISAVG